MIDFLLGLYLAALALRGWVRGFVRELFDLAGLLVGLAVSFRLSGPVGDFLSEAFGVTPEWARIGAGVALFIVVGVVLAIGAGALTRVMRLPGLNLANRVFGAGFALGWGVLLVVLIASLLRALPMPAPVDDALDDSVVVTTLTDGVAGSVFDRLVGDDVLTALRDLKTALGSRRLLLQGDEKVEFGETDPSSLEVDDEAARLVFELLNETRAEEGVPPLAWSEGLAAVALGHAEEMYVAGYVSHLSPVTGRVEDRVAAAGIRLATLGENLALAASARAVHDGLAASPGHRANMVNPAFDRAGIAAVRGPLGLMVVEVFGG